MTFRQRASLLLGLCVTPGYLLRAQLPVSENPAQPVATVVQPSINMPGGSWLNLSFAQSSSSNWSQPGQDFASVGTAWVSTTNHWTTGPLQIKAVVNTRLGATYLDDSTTTEKVRVTDNEVFAEGVISYSLGWQVSPYISAGFRTSVTEAFSYGPTSKFRVARLWDPVTSQQALGWTYTYLRSHSVLSTRLGISLQQVRAKDHTQMSDDPKTPREKEAYKAQSGIEWVSDAVLRLDTNISFNGRLTLMSSFQESEIWMVRSENIIQFRLWKFVGATLAFNIIHDIRQTRRTQFKQSLMLGIVQEF